MERKKVSWEKQVEIVERYLRGEVGYRESVKAANNCKSSFRRWVAQYQKFQLGARFPQRVLANLRDDEGLVFRRLLPANL